ncbi:MAG: hypothetical protein H6Q10_816 [Acidobacteria bacterium]|nr:hypothetical protein [Acidobacteriota bacterium]
MKLILRAALVAFALAAALPGAAGQSATPFDTKATVVVKSDDKVIPLDRREQIAFMFVDAIRSLLGDCRSHAAEPCTLEALIRGPKAKDDWGVGKLTFDPNATDPNYTYSVTLGDDASWQVRADPKTAGLGGFYAKGPSFGGTWYNAAGRAGQADTALTETSVEGDLFFVK